MDYEGNPVDATSEKLLNQRVRDWRSATGDPSFYYPLSGNSIRLVPTPAETKPLSVKLTVALVPVRGVLGMGEDFIEDHYEALTAGALNKIGGFRRFADGK